MAVLAVTALSSVSLVAQNTTHPGLNKQLERLDFGINAEGVLNANSSGTVFPVVASTVGTTLTVQPSNTVGVGVNLRYVARPFIGFEGNFGYARYTQNFTDPSNLQADGQPTFSVQNNADEYTLGYLVTPTQTLFGTHPYASVGTGVLAFKPTRGGGENLQTQARQAYYYTAGVQQDVLGKHLGVRLGVRQLFFLAPDFGQNYLTIKQHTNTFEPTLGFFVHY